MSQPSALVGLVLLASAPALVAQQTLIVDRYNRPGTHFTDIPPAEAAAQPGDTIFVRGVDTRYTPIITSKALRLIGDGNASIDTSQAPMIIRQIAAGQEFVLAGFWINGIASTPSGVRVENSQGRVHLDRIMVTLLSPNLMPALEINACSAVSVSAYGIFLGTPGLKIANSHVTLQGCISTANGLGPSASSFPGAIIDNSTVSAAYATFAAGNGSSTLVPGTGLVMTNSIVALARGAWIRASLQGTVPIEAVQGSGVLLVDPTVQIQPLGSAARTVGVTEVQVPQSAMTAQYRYGLGVRTVVDSPAGDLYVMLVGRPMSPVTVAFPQELWLDPASIQVVAVGTQGASGQTTLDLPLPGGLPHGVPLAFQTLSGPITALQLTVPAIVATP